jgi:hypothetical protein
MNSATTKKGKTRKDVEAGSDTITSPLNPGGRSDNKPNYMEGYLTKKGVASTIFTDPWTRRFFVLQVY